MGKGKWVIVTIAVVLILMVFAMIWLVAEALTFAPI